MATNMEISQAFDKARTLLPAGKAKEEQELINIGIWLLETALKNLNSIAISLEAIADQKGTAPEPENPNQMKLGL